MKKWMIVCCLFCLALAATAQNRGGMQQTPEERAQMLSDKMKKELSLNDDQYAKIKDVNLKYAKKNDDIRNGDGDRMAKMKAVKASADEKDKEVKGILDAGQYEKYKAMLEEQKEKMKERRRQ